MAKKENNDIATANAPEGNRFEKVLVENFVSLQQVLTNLSVKFDNLANQISKLLELFEISAKSLAKRGGFEEEKSDKGAAEKLDNLLEQNKVIAKGIALLHEKGSEEPSYGMSNPPTRQFQPRLPQRPPYESFKDTELTE